MKVNKKKVLIIGLDGATFNVIQPMLKTGRLPVIGRLMQQGAWGELRSTVPPVTPPAWTSFMTGKNPGKHGVFGFYGATKGSYQTEMVTGRSIKSKKFWDYLVQKKIGLVDIPLTYPPEPVNGYMISGWPVPSDDHVFTYPPELHTEIIREAGGYMIDKTLAALSRENFKEALDNLYRYTRMRRDAALYLMQKKGPLDLFAIVFRGTDFIQHEAFKFMDPVYAGKHPDESLKFGDTIFQFYEYMDRVVADLMQAMGDNVVTVIMSDHGAGPMKKRFYFNRWLRQEGFLSVRKWIPRRRPGLYRLSLSELLKKTGLKHLSRRVPEKFKQAMVPCPRMSVTHPLTRMDWRKTRAFSNLIWTDGVVRINLKGREPSGCVPESDYDRVREELSEKLKRLKDPETGEPVIDQILKPEEIYHGPQLEAAPDLFVLTAETSHMFSPELDPGEILETPDNPAPAPHRMEGVFIIHGPDIKQAAGIKGLSLVDIAPTVLYLLGAVVPGEMDGKIIREVFRDDYLTARPPEISSPENRDEGKSQAEALLPEEKKELEEIMRSLGYMQ